MTATLKQPQTYTDTKLQELPLTDEELLVRYRDTGDRELFARLVQQYEREL